MRETRGGFYKSAVTRLNRKFTKRKGNRSRPNQGQAQQRTEGWRGRLTSLQGNIIMAYECLHFMKRNKALKHRSCALKLDMMKAYDRVEWDYLEAIMLKLGFSRIWVDRVMSMVKSVSFSVLFNGNKLEVFKPTRGIRQGDPISSYLFLLAAEGLSGLLKSRDQSSQVGGIQVAPSAPPVNHLLFADDSLLFFKANGAGATEVSNLLNSYCQALGQRINSSKSSVFFSKGCPESTRQEVKGILNVQTETLNEKYLGMPSDIGTSKTGAFKYLKDRLWNKVKGWIEKAISAAGKEILIKSVAQAVLVFSMSCFKLPRGLCEHLNKLIRQFFWGSKEGKRKPHWVSWQTMTQPKKNGGLGFRDLELFNLALLARQAWRLLTMPDSLCAKLLKAIYFPEVSIMDAEVGSHPSQVWRSLIEGRDVLAHGLIRRIGDGSSIEVWMHNWIPRDTSMKPIACLRPNPPILVSELIDAANVAWRSDLLQQYFLPIDIQSITNIPLCTMPMADFWAWQFEKKGPFSVRSAYRLLAETKKRGEDLLQGRVSVSNMSQEEKGWTTLWSPKIPSKIKTFLWRLAKQSLPTEDVRKQRHMSIIDKCQLCGTVDSWKHSLMECSMARCVWALADEEIVEVMADATEPSAKHWLFHVQGSLSHAEFVEVAVTLWAIWTARRKAIHEEVYQSPLATHKFVKHFLAELETISMLSQRTLQRPAVRAVVQQWTKWIPPPNGFMKINVDAALSDTGLGAAAAVCRDSTGLYLGSSAVVIQGATVPTVVEAIACREALSLAHDLSLQYFVVACDCKTVVDDIQKGKGGTYMSVIKEIFIRSSLFNSCNFIFEGRASNLDAHKLAKDSLALDRGRHLWLIHPHDPLCIPLNVQLDE